jgi:glucose uptake protein GlcU
MGCVLAIIAGVLFGLVFIPSTYIQDHPYDQYQTASKNGLHYVFAMYSGIFFSSMFYYIVYIAYTGNRPYVHVQSIFPAIISGIMWGIAQAGFLVANSVLSQAISFPLVTIGPSTTATLWSIFYFKEISGQRNYLIIISGTLLRIISAVLIVLSKPIPR